MLSRFGHYLPDQITVHVEAGYASQKTRDLLIELGCVWDSSTKDDPLQAGCRWVVDVPQRGTLVALKTADLYRATGSSQ